MISGLNPFFPGLLATEIAAFLANSLLEPSIKFSKRYCLFMLFLCKGAVVDPVLDSEAFKGVGSLSLMINR